MGLSRQEGGGLRPATHEVRLVVYSNGLGSIMVDGVDLSRAVNGVEFQSQVGDTTRMNLSLVAPRIEFDGPATIEVLDKTRDALIALGWTPPAEDVE